MRKKFKFLTVCIIFIIILGFGKAYNVYGYTKKTNVLEDNSQTSYAKDKTPSADNTLKIYDYAKDRKKYLLDSSILNESCTTKLYSSRLIAEAGVRYAENVAYEEPLFTYPLKFYADRVAVTQAQLYYYRYNENGTMLSYMNNPSTMVQHLQVQQDVYTRMSNSGYMDEFRDEINLYFLHSFYAETFYFMAARRMPMPAVMLRYMINVVKKYIPDYKDNPYIGYPGVREEMESLKLIDCAGLSDDELEKMAADYMRNCI